MTNEECKDPRSRLCWVGGGGGGREVVARWLIIRYGGEVR